MVNRIIILTSFLILLFVSANVFAQQNEKPYTSLFDGKDFEGWDIFLNNKGLNNDTAHNFLIEDGVIHVVGKELGYIRTKKSFRNYRLTVEFKWGEKKWPPHENMKRDAGICYNIPRDEPDSIWPKSIEFQIQEGDVGDFWLLGFSTIRVRDSVNTPANHTRMLKVTDAEKPHGEWNTLELISSNGRCVHIVNGVVANEGKEASVTQGRILLQSEYAEVYYRNIKIQEL
jgi:hypothetical protein